MFDWLFGRSEPIPHTVIPAPEPPPQYRIIENGLGEFFVQERHTHASEFEYRYYYATIPSQEPAQTLERAREKRDDLIKRSQWKVVE